MPLLDELKFLLATPDLCIYIGSIDPIIPIVLYFSHNVSLNLQGFTWAVCILAILLKLAMSSFFVNSILIIILSNSFFIYVVFLLCSNFKFYGQH